MRAIRGGAPGASAADMFTAMRDNPRLAAPTAPAEVEGFADLLRPMPPSRAHLKRLARDRSDAFKAEPRVAPCPRGERYEFFQQQIGKLSQIGAVKGWEPPAPIEKREVVMQERGVERPLTDEQHDIRINQFWREVVKLRALMHKFPGDADVKARKKAAILRWSSAVRARR